MKLFAFNAALAGKLCAALTLAVFTIPQTGSAGEIEVKRASAEYRDSRQFYRISEFFTGRENTSGYVIRRSRPEERGGFYLSVKLDEYPYHEVPVEEAILLEVILPGDIEPTLFSFPLGPDERENPPILVGLTGEDWPDPSALPLAWRISFANAEGAILAREQSFLWGQE